MDMFVCLFILTLLVVLLLAFWLKSKTNSVQLQSVLNREQNENKRISADLNEIKSELQTKVQLILELTGKLASEKQRSESLALQLEEMSRIADRNQQKMTDYIERLQDLSGNYSAQKERNEGLQSQLEQQKIQFETNKEQIKTEIQNLSNSILDEKSKKFTEQNSIQLKQILEPLGLRIDEFKKKVEDTYSEENKERATLKEQIRQMAELNQKMSVEAQNLTKALKGDSKTQGNWGEVILERILEKSGLRKGYEFEVQVTERNEENKLIRPDVIVKLPDDKYMIVDSKVSLTAYEKFVNAEIDEERAKHIKLHLVSLKSHIKGLTEKNYQLLHGTQSPDFVLLFIPIQPAFDVAMMNEPDLYNFAFEKNIILVSPTTLLATLSTVNSVWKQEYQTKHALEIAEKSGAMYDKFVGFVDDLEKVGKAIDSTNKAYGDAMNKLVTGKGNLVRRSESLKELGIKATKKISQQLMEQSGFNENEDSDSNR